jgi:hypothetical protein
MPRARKRSGPSLPPMPTGMMPTPHAMRRHEYELTRVKRNGPKVARNTNGSPLQARLKSGAITEQQREAGEHFEAARGLAFGESSASAIALLMTLGVRVQRGSAEHALGARMWAARTVDEVRGQCHPLGYDALVDICCLGRYFGRRTGREEAFRRLVEALDACARVFGVPDYDG